MVNSRVGGNELGSGLTESNNNKLLALLALIRRSTEPNSWHKCAHIHGRVSLSLFFFFWLCLNALYCHEKALVGTVASFLLMSSCG